MRTIGNRSVASFLAVLLNVAWYLVALALAITVSFVVLGWDVAVHVGSSGSPSVEAGSGLKMSIPVSVSLDPRTFRVTAPSLGIEDAQIQEVRGSLRFPPRRGAVFFANLSVIIGLLGLTLWVLGQLHALFRTLQAGQPFVPANASRVRRIAWVVIFGEILRSAVVFFENYYAMTHFSAAGLSFNARPELNAFAIINGLIILVIAEVFRAGTRLDEEQSLTV